MKIHLPDPSLIGVDTTNTSTDLSSDEFDMLHERSPSIAFLRKEVNQNETTMIIVAYHEVPITTVRGSSKRTEEIHVHEFARYCSSREG